MSATAATQTRVLASGRPLRLQDQVAEAVAITLARSARESSHRPAWNWIAAGYLGVALGAAALLSPLRSQAQEAQAAQDATAAGEIAEITVTGTRIARDGFEAPTPVSVLGVEEIQAAAVASITEFVTQLPSVLGSQTAATNSGSLSNGQAGIAALNLRSLGANRTLVLLDGQRSVTSASTGLVDVNTFPQALVQRVEIVTGGASAAYGSDAVGGVVNMILDREFTGIKSDYEFGITGYDDLPNHKFTLTGGMPFAGGRGHLLFNGEFYTQDGIQTVDRDWNDAGYFQIDNPAYVVTNGVGNGQPSRYVGPNVGPSQQSPGGVITSGPLRGTYFGTINPVTGVATTGTMAFGQVSGPWMIGGDWEYSGQEHTSSNSLNGDEERTGLFTRASWDLTDSVSVFAQLSYNKFEGLSYYQQTPNQANVTIRSDNAYLPASVRAQMQTLGLQSFTMGTSNAGIPAAGSNNERTVERYVVGADGDFGLLSRDWSWDFYYQLGIAKTDEMLVNTWNNALMARAQDAVFDGSGNIVCRSTLTTPDGCVPINRIGVGGITQAALDYIIPSNPLREQELKQDVAALTFSTPNVVDIWAGPVSLAFGAEWRKEQIDGTVDPQYESGWLYGNYKVTAGDYSVKEAFVETVVPLFRGLEFNGAFRATDYSVSGSVETWKMGLTWRPIDDVLLRYTTSRDIRAPNLSELFAAGTARTNSVNVPDGAGGIVRADQFVENTTGSLALTPESADSWGFGIVLTPRFLPGFAFSADYFDIDISDAIGTINAQNTINLCYEQGNQALCNNLIYASGGPNVAGSDIVQINIIPINFSTQRNRGIDFEASYRFSAGPGDMTVRALATHYIENLTNNGIDAPTDDAGTNDGGSTPNWNYRLSTTYSLDPVSFTVTARGFSDGKYSNEWIECTSNCPTSTPAVRTINENDIDGSFYLDASANYSFSLGPTQAEAFFAIRNIANKDPVLVGNGPTGNNTNAYPQTNRSLYDTLGRTFRLGLRMSF